MPSKRTPRRNMTITPERSRYLRDLLLYDLRDTELSDDERRMAAAMAQKLWDVPKDTEITITPNKALYLKELIEDDMALTELSNREISIAQQLLNKINGVIWAFKRFGEMNE